MLDSTKIKRSTLLKGTISGISSLLLGVSCFVNSATTVPDFNHYKTVLEKKKAFFSYLLPEIKKQNNRLLEQRATIFDVQDKIQQQQDPDEVQMLKIASLRNTYNIDEDVSLENGLAELLIRVDVIPADLALIQAANESGWGTSRFAKQGYNFFGVWCFTKGCGFVPYQRESGDFHEVAKFRDLSHGVMAYMHNLNSNRAYTELWKIRYQQRLAQQPLSGKELVHGLKHYSQRGYHYVSELLSMLHVNRKHMTL